MTEAGDLSPARRTINEFLSAGGTTGDTSDKTYRSVVAAATSPKALTNRPRLLKHSVPELMHAHSIHLSDGG
jgi:hypothetical protein